MNARLPQPGPVLIVEDDNDIRDALSQILLDEGYEVLSAPNGLAGLELLQERRPALVLLDLMMPVMNGWQFRQRQLQDRALADIPVVVISADSIARRESSAMNADGFLQKPIELDVLLETIESFCVEPREAVTVQTLP